MCINSNHYIGTNKMTQKNITECEKGKVNSQNNLIFKEVKGGKLK